MKCIGIDPGANGGIALIDYSLCTVSVYPFSKEKLIDVCKENCSAVAIVEKVHAMPNQGVVSMFNFGENFGYIQGVLDSFGIKTFLIPPQTWKSYYNLSSDKQLSINKARELYPDVNLLRTPKCKKEHDGMAEALLLADFGRRIL